MKKRKLPKLPIWYDYDIWREFYPESGNYLVYTQNSAGSGIMMAYWDEEQLMWFTEKGGDSEVKGVTHYMRLPDEPFAYAPSTNAF